MRHFIQWVENWNTDISSPRPFSTHFPLVIVVKKFCNLHLKQSLTEPATPLLMLQRRLDQSLPPPTAPISSAQTQRAWARGKSFQISQLIAGVSKRGEQAWRASVESKRGEQAWRASPPPPPRKGLIPHCVRTATHTHTQHTLTHTQHSAVTTQWPHPGNYAWPFSFSRPRCSRDLYET